MRVRLVVVLAAAMVISACGGEAQPSQQLPAPSPPPTTQPAAPPGYQPGPAWQENFAGDQLDEAVWEVLDNSTYGQADGQLQCYQAGNVRVADGALSLTAQRENVLCGGRKNPGDYSSAFLRTTGKKSFLYGTFTIVTRQLPLQPGSSQGLWPAVWMRPTDSGDGEMDLLEAIGSNDPTRPVRMVASVHHDYRAQVPKQVQHVDLPAGFDPNQAHTFQFVWTPQSMTWSVDGRQIARVDAATTPWFTQVFTKPYDLRVNLAVGGQWPGNPDQATQMPARLSIDSITYQPWLP